MLDFLHAHSNVIVSMVFAAMLGMSLYFPLMAGQLSLASPGFYALGGYVAAVLSTKVFKVENGAHFPIPLLLVEMLVAAVLCAALAIVVGIPGVHMPKIGSQASLTPKRYMPMKATKKPGTDTPKNAPTVIA